MKKVTITNNNDIEVEVSPEFAKIIEQIYQCKSSEMLIQSDEKLNFIDSPKRKIDEISVDEQILFLELMCFSCTELSKEKRIENTLCLVYGIDPIISEDGYTILNYGIRIDLLKKLSERYSSNPNRRIIFNEISNLIKRFQDIPYTDNMKKLDSHWFKVGLKFATGEIYHKIELYSKDDEGNCNYSKVGESIGEKNYRLYIKATHENIKKGKPNADKNIFKYPDKMNFICEYCRIRNLEIHEFFQKKAKQQYSMNGN